MVNVIVVEAVIDDEFASVPIIVRVYVPLVASEELDEDPQPMSPRLSTTPKMAA